MDVMPLQAVIFISIPEAYLIILMGFTFIGVKPDLKRLGVVAAAQALCSYLIRSLPLPFGVHIILQLFPMAILVKFIIGYKWKHVLLGVFLGAAIFTGILDSLYIPLVVRIVPFEVIYNNPWVRIAVSIPEQLAMLVIILLCKKYNFKIVNFSACDKEVM